jgi:hypothetical protein
MKTKGIHIVFSLFIFLSFNSIAQWNQIGYMTTGADTATSVGRYEGFGGNLYAATNKGIFKSIDDGNTWTNISYNAPVTQSVSMASVLEESVSIIYAGGDKRLYKSTNSGISWTWLPLPKDTISITDIKRSGNNIVVSYNKSFASGGVFYSSNNGASWFSATGIPAANYMQDLMVEGDTVYATGKSGVFKSSDNGITFAPLGTGIPNCREMTRHQGNLFGADGGGTGLYTSTNNGTTWAQANTTIFGGFCQVLSVTQAPSVILASVTGNTACMNTTGSVKASMDGGMTWSSFTVGLSGGPGELGTNAANNYFFCKVGKKNFRTGLISGIKSLSYEPELKAYFDPSGILHIYVANTTNIDVRIYSMEGKLLHSENTSESEIKINELKNNPQGVYLISLSVQNKAWNKKVLKQE